MNWAEVLPDTILAALFTYVIIRLATSSDSYFKTPFYVFFLVTGLYSLTSVLSYLIMVQYLHLDKNWTEYVYKPTYGAATFGSVGSSIGKAFIAIHRYFVMRTHDFTEKKLPSKVISLMLISQFIIAVSVTAPIWLSTSFTMKNGIIVNISKENIVILKAITVSIFTAYIICNSICTILTSREFIRFRRLLEGNSDSKAIIVQQRNMFIVVTVCSITHLIKAVQQFLVAFATYFDYQDLYALVWPMYPLVNGLAAYAAPLCLVIFSSKVRARLFFRKPAKHNHSITAVQLRK